jgi:hypothetical protein
MSSWAIIAQDENGPIMRLDLGRLSDGASVMLRLELERDGIDSYSAAFSLWTRRGLCPDPISGGERVDPLTLEEAQREAVAWALEVAPSKKAWNAVRAALRLELDRLGKEDKA